MKGKRETIGGGCARGMYSHSCIWSLVPQQLASFPGLRIGRGYSAVVLDRSQAPPSSPSLFCTGMLGGGWEWGYISLARLPQQLHKQHACLSLMSWAYSACAFCSAVPTARSAVTFDSTFLFDCWGSSVVCVGHFENTIVPYRRPPKLYFENFNINYPLDLLEEHGSIFKFFTTRLSLFNEYEITYIHTDAACVQHINVGLAQARPNICVSVQYL